MMGGEGMSDIANMRVHFIGIGGAGLSAVARVLLEQGAIVSGSDLVVSPVAEALARDGALVSEGHDARNLFTGPRRAVDVVVASSAVPDDNVEIQAARAKGIPVVRRPAFLGHMMDGKRGVAVAGTHGKTTTTAMIAAILLKAERDPTFIVGGVLADLETNARAGAGPLFVVEADEYDHTFLSLKPELAVITNVEHDHPDCYPTFEDFRSAFEGFAALVPDRGLLAVCADDPVARAIGRSHAAGALAGTEGSATPTVRFFGLSEEATWRAEEIHPNFAGGIDFLAVHQGETLGLVRLRVPGAHNASNAMAALAVTDFLDVPFSVAREALTGFRGVARRFEIKGMAEGVVVIDDYAHHPTEIRATLGAARERFPERRIWAVWQPHTYSRTKELLDDFAASFDDADRVIVLPIYPARETDTLGVSAADVVDAMHRAAPTTEGSAAASASKKGSAAASASKKGSAAASASFHVQVAGSMDEAVDLLLAAVQPGDAVLTLGAGDGNQVGERLLARLGGKADAKT
jgi:UDP-N-acetylmuramate--alanine ligase